MPASFHRPHAPRDPVVPSLLFQPFSNALVRPSQAGHRSRLCPPSKTAQRASPAGPCKPSGVLPRYIRQRTRFSRVNSEFHYRKLRLADIAQRAAPVVGNCREARARGDTFFRKAFFLVVDPAANQADPALIFSHFNYFAHDVLFSRSMQDPPSLPLFWARRRPAILPEFVKWTADYLCGIAAKRLRHDRACVTDLVIHSVYASIRSSFFGQA